MKIVGVIPARMGSSRFPGKPMAEIGGIPMVGHCYFRSLISKRLDAVILATCDEEIAKYGRSVDALTIMTKDTHTTASDRAAEAMLHYEKMTGERVDILVMIQGDEPMVLPEMIDAAIEGLIDDPKAKVANLVAPILGEKAFEDRAEIKVCLDQNGYALFFSREPIPSRSKVKGPVPMFKQVCVIPFRRDYLLSFNDTPVTPLEAVENIDMLRVLETGGRVKMIPTDAVSYSVDTPEDLAFVREEMANDPLIADYLEKARA